MVLRVLHLITRLELGGAQRNTLFTVGHIDRREFIPALAWGPGGILDPESGKLEGVRLFPLPSLDRQPSARKDFRALREIRDTLRAFRPHILHTHPSKAGVLGRLAGRLEQVPAVIHSVHGWGFTPTQSPPKRAFFFLAERIASRWSTHWITVSEANRREGAVRGLLDPQRTSLIRSGIDLEVFRRSRDRSRIRRELDLPEDAFVLLQVGNFKAQKAPLDFVKLAATVARHEPSACFLMAGDGPLRAGVEREIRHHGLEGRLRLLGWVEDIPALWQAADIGVLTSRHEGLPRAVLEALASGRPVVATAVDGTPEAVSPGVNGFLFDPGDLSAAAGYILRMIRDPVLYRRLAGAARENIAEFDIDLMLRQQEELYRCLISRPN